MAPPHLLELGKLSLTSFHLSNALQVSTQRQGFHPRFRFCSLTAGTMFCQRPLVFTGIHCTRALGENVYVNVQLCNPAVGHKLQLCGFFWGR